MRRVIRSSVCIGAAAVAYAVGALAEAPAKYAITGARLVTAAGAPIVKGTIVLRDGVIEAVGADVQAPADAVVIDGAGMTVYPGLIDMGTSQGLNVDTVAQPSSFRTTEDQERWKRSVIFRPDLMAANHVQPDSPELSRLAAVGITTVLAVPPGSLVRGQSALVNIAAPPDQPQVGALADPRRGLQIVRTPVALHVNLGATGGGRGGYPVSLLGTIAFVRQHFLDAQHQQLAQQHYARAKVSTSRPVHDPALEALQPALARRLPVAFEANLAREIMRSLDMAQEFNLDPVITGGREADDVVDVLKARNARVIFNVNYPTRPRTLAPDADEPVRVLRERADAPNTPAALAKAGVPFAFSSDGVREPRDFLRNVARAVKGGLAPDAAIRALTIDAARIAGAETRVGTLERGKIANVIVADGDLFEEKTRVRHAFVDGRLVDVEERPQPAGRGRGRGSDR